MERNSGENMSRKSIADDEELMREWNYAKNINIDPQKIATRSHKKVWWKCLKNHEWQAAISNRTSTEGSNCPYCANKKVLQGYNDLVSQKPEIAQEFDIMKNVASPENVYYRSNKQYWWICAKKHSYESKLSYRIDRDIGCPYCSGRYAIRGENDLATTHPHISSQWSSKNIIQPYEVKAGSNKNVWWQCEKAHEWKTTVHNRVIGKGCPYCSNNKVWIGYNDLLTTHKDIEQFWDYEKNDSIKITDVSYGSHKIAWWKCDKGHSYQLDVKSKISNIHDCSICAISFSVSNQEKELLTFIQQIYPGEVITNSKKMIAPYELDIFLPELNLALEFNGLYWHSEQSLKNKYYHFNKWKKCVDNNIVLVNIWEDDWKYTQDIAKSILQDYIQYHDKINHQFVGIDDNFLNKYSSVFRRLQHDNWNDKSDKRHDEHITLDNGNIFELILRLDGFSVCDSGDIEHWNVKNKKRRLCDTSDPVDVLSCRCADSEKVYDAGQSIWMKKLV